MRPPSFLRAAALFGAAAAAAACGGDLPTESAAAGRPAAYDVTLAAGPAPAAALLLRLDGAGVDSVTAAAALEADEVDAEGATRRVVLLGALESGVVATVWLRPGAARPAAAVEQVSEAAGHALADPAAWRVALAPR